MKTKRIWLVLTLLIVTTPLLVSYRQATPQALVQKIEAVVQNTAPSYTITSTTLATGNTIVVSSTADSGPGTLRQALESAKSGDTIIFDSDIFPPNTPATIYLRSQLPGIGQGNLTIDASNAGVILDGNNISEGFVVGLHLTSDGNTVQGLRFINFDPGAGISLSHGAQNNMIGGNRSIGSGLLGQGNLISNGCIGISLWGEATSFNIILGNMIGIDPTGSEDLGNNGGGICFSEGASYNVVGPDNIIAYNNSPGITLSDEGTSFNTITGNLIGTDPMGTEDRGNELDGIWIGDGASRNIIGPDNVIAYNNHYGIHIGVDLERHSLNFPIGNSITGNSIYNNIRGGIKLWGDSNSRLVAPTILDFNLSSGTITGIACANCTVEVFSDSSVQGEVYEGQAKADTSGVFIFNKGTSFTGPNLTATATDNEGNTSQFSTPTLGTSRSIVLQEGNNMPKLQIQPTKSSELVDNRLGTMGPADVRSDGAIDDWIYKMITYMGYKWIRLSIDRFDWTEITGTGAYSKHDISPYQDKAITALSDSGIKIICTLVFWDQEMDAKGYFGWFKTEEQIQRYLDYVQFIVHHFKDRIQYYEILNEPEIKEFGQQHVEVADYINLVRRTVPVIRQEDPEAKIVAGAVSSLSNHKDNMKYFFNIIESDVMPLVDAVSWHAGPSSPEFQAKYYYNYPDLVQEIKDTASAHGFEGEYIIEELNWRTPKEPHPTEYTEYSELASAKYYARGIVMNLGMNFAHVGLAGPQPQQYDELPYATRVIRNLSTIMAGAESVNLSLEVQREAQSFFGGCSLACDSTKNIIYYSFSLPNGDKLVALWIDGKAVDNYPGVKTTLTIHSSARRAVGIDALNGFEQELRTSMEEGNLVIKNLLVKDYPIILRLSP